MIVIMCDDLVEQLLVMARRRRALELRACLFHRGDPVEQVFVVEQGAIELMRSQIDGQPLVLQRAGPQSVLAEASLYSEHYHCDAMAVTPSRVAVLTKPEVLARLDSDRAFSGLWSRHLATQMQQSRLRSEILSRKTVAARLDAWLSLGRGGLPARGEWKNLAGQLGVSPEALYRELSRRRG